MAASAARNGSSSGAAGDRPAALPSGAPEGAHAAGGAGGPVSTPKASPTPRDGGKQRGVVILERSVYVSRKRREYEFDSTDRCGCVPDPAVNKGRTCDTDACSNRASKIECVRGKCRAKKKCMNMRFQMREVPRIERFKAGEKGYGLRALEPIAAGQFIEEYMGEIIDEEEYEKRLIEYTNRKHFYMMSVGDGEYVDAFSKGSLARFVNHSCDPNAKTETWVVLGEKVVGCFALRDIAAGEEITFDYGWTRRGFKRMRCHCGTAKCRGFVGAEQEGDTELPWGVFRNATPADRALGEKLVGRYIKVWWPNKPYRRFFVAKVEGYDEDAGKHSIVYVDDDQHADEDFRELKTIWQLLHENEDGDDDPPPTAKKKEAADGVDAAAAGLTSPVARAPATPSSAQLQTAAALARAASLSKMPATPPAAPVPTGPVLPEVQAPSYGVKRCSRRRGLEFPIVLDWRFDARELVHTPSIDDSVSVEHEWAARARVAAVIKRAGTQLAIGSSAVWVRAVIMSQRFYTAHSLRSSPIRAVAAACLLLAAKSFANSKDKAMEGVRRFLKKKDAAVAAAAVVDDVFDGTATAEEGVSAASSAAAGGADGAGVLAAADSSTAVEDVVEAERRLLVALRFEVNITCPVAAVAGIVRDVVVTGAVLPSALGNEQELTKKAITAVEEALVMRPACSLVCRPENLARMGVLLAIYRGLGGPAAPRQRPAWLSKLDAADVAEVKCCAAEIYAPDVLPRGARDENAGLPNDGIVQHLAGWMWDLRPGEALPSMPDLGLRVAASDTHIRSVRCFTLDARASKVGFAGRSLFDLDRDGYKDKVLLERWPEKAAKSSSAKFGISLSGMDHLTVLRRLFTPGPNPKWPEPALLRPVELVAGQAWQPALAAARAETERRAEDGAESDKVPAAERASLDPAALVSEYTTHDLAGLLDEATVAFSEDDLRCLAQSLCSALHHMHNSDCLHRALTPAKVGVTRTGAVRVGRLAHARRFNRGRVAERFSNISGRGIDGARRSLNDDREARHAPFELRDDMKPSAFIYLAPEILLGCTWWSPAVDMYAVGAILAHAASARKKPLFHGRTLEEHTRKLLKVCGALEKVWPAGRALPRAAKYDAKGHKDHLEDHLRKSAKLSDSAVEFVESLMRVDPTTRMDAHTALAHPWLDGAPKLLSLPRGLAPKRKYGSAPAGHDAGGGAANGGAGGGERRPSTDAPASSNGRHRGDDRSRRRDDDSGSGRRHGDDSSRRHSHGHGHERSRRDSRHDADMEESRGRDSRRDEDMEKPRSRKAERASRWGEPDEQQEARRKRSRWDD